MRWTGRGKLIWHGKRLTQGIKKKFRDETVEGRDCTEVESDLYESFVFGYHANHHNEINAYRSIFLLLPAYDGTEH